MMPLTLHKGLLQELDLFTNSCTFSIESKIQLSLVYRMMLHSWIDSPLNQNHRCEHKCELIITQECFYGHQDHSHTTGMRWISFLPEIIKDSPNSQTVEIC